MARIGELTATVKEVRVWAARRGLCVGPQGLPRPVIDAWNTAHPKKPYVVGITKRRKSGLGYPQ